MINRKNWLLTKKYLNYRREHDPNLSEKSLSRYQWHLRHLLIWADEDGFAQALKNKRPRFPTYLREIAGKKTSIPISKESQKKIVQVARALLEWLLKYHPRDVPGLTPELVDELVPTRVPRTHKEPRSIHLEDLLELIRFPFPDTLRNKRDLAAACLLFASGARADAIASAPILSLQLQKLSFNQDPQLGVRTKNSVSQTTFLLNIPELLEKIQIWDRIVRTQLPETTPWFTVIDARWGVEQLTTRPASRTRAQDLLKAVRRLFKLAGMEDKYKSPHKFRSGHAMYGLTDCKNMEEYHALSRNLMHANLAVTDQYYSVLEHGQRQAIITTLGNRQTDDPFTRLTPQPQESAKIRHIMKLLEELVLDDAGHSPQSSSPATTSNCPPG